MGQAFRVDGATLEGDLLTLYQGQEESPKRAIRIFLFLDGESVEKQHFDIETSDQLGVPHVEVLPKGKEDKGALKYTGGYALRLQFTKLRDDGSIKARLYLSLPDERSWLAGYFKAQERLVTLKGAGGEEVVVEAPWNDDPVIEAEGRPLDLESDPNAAQALGVAMVAAFPAFNKFMLVIGLLVSVSCSIWFLVIAFKDHVGWGIGCMLPFVGGFVSLFFFITRFSETWRPVLFSFLGSMLAAWALFNGFSYMASSPEIMSHKMVEELQSMGYDTTELEGMMNGEAP